MLFQLMELTLPYQVDCYTLLQENSTNTENSLRGVFSRATDFSPCVLLLRHLEALMYITQQLDPTQGATFRSPLFGKLTNQLPQEPRIALVLQECLDGLLQPWRLTGHPLVVVGTTSTAQECSPGLLGCFKHEISIEVGYALCPSTLFQAKTHSPRMSFNVAKSGG